MKRSVFTSILLVISLGAIVSCKPLEGSASQATVPSPTSANTLVPASPTEQIIFTGAAAGATQSAEYKNIGYTIDGQLVVLTNGVSTIAAAPGASAQVVTRIIGYQAYGDINGDGVEDVAFILTQDMGGSGTFFYVAAALSTQKGWQGLNAVILGDRISPLSTIIENGMIVVNYDVRKPGDPFSALPSIGVIKNLKVIDNKLVEIIP